MHHRNKLETETRTTAAFDEIGICDSWWLVLDGLELQLLKSSADLISRQRIMLIAKVIANCNFQLQLAVLQLQLQLADFAM